jgi:hypothetical protein
MVGPFLYFQRRSFNDIRRRRAKKKPIYALYAYNQAVTTITQKSVDISPAKVSTVYEFSQIHVMHERYFTRKVKKNKTLLKKS